MEGIIKSHIGEELTSQGFRNCDYNINYIYRQHLNDQTDMKYSALVSLHKDRLIKSENNN